MHQLETRRQAGLSMVSTDEGGQKHTQTRDKETKRGGGGLSMTNIDGGGQKHIQTRDKETKGEGV